MPDVIDMLQALPHAVTPDPAGPDLAAADVARGHRALRQRRRRGLAGVAGTVAVVGVGVALVATSTQPTTPAVSASRTPGTTSPLMTLAAQITAVRGPLPGDASLIIRTQTDAGIPPQVSYNLYTDGGAFYGGGDKKSLMTAVARHENMADGINAREVAAARSAATADLGAARVRMINASPNDLGLGLSPADRKKIWDKARAKTNEILKQKGVKKQIPVDPPTGTALRGYEDNYLWNNSVDALSAGAGDPQVRAGVLRLLSTISAVTVTKSTTGGQRTLTLTAGPAVFGGSDTQVLTINATTGMPVKSVFPGKGGTPSDVQTFKVYRVKLTDIQSGRF